MPIKFLFSLILIFTPIVHADEVLEENISVKALGMGNAYLTQGKGHDAIFYNPAGLASLSGFQWRIMGLNLGLNGIDVYDEYADIVDNSDNLPATLNALYGKPVWARMDLQTTLSFGSLIVGAFGRSNVGFTLLNPALPSLQSAYFADYGLMAGWGVEVIPSFMESGVVVKRITRYAGDVSIGASSLVYLDSDILENSIERSGTGYSADWGAKFNFPGSWKPTLGFVWQDIGDTTFNLNADDPAPQSIKDQMSVGLGFEKDFVLFKVRPALDVRHLNIDNSEMQIGKKLHVGLELDFPGFALRGGLNQGYYTAGASFDLWLFQIDVATYGVELGEYVGQHEDRRYILQMTMDFGFDPSGSWFNFSKERQRARRGTLKERR